MAGSTRRESRDEPTASEREIVRCVQFALRTALPERIQQERRRERRHAFPYPVRLEPVDAQGEAIGEPLVVLGKHISNHGLDFYYHQSIPFRRAIARFESNPDQEVELVMALTWCRFGRHGWYENGGRFLSAAVRGGRSLPPSSGLVTAEMLPAGLVLG